MNKKEIYLVRHPETTWNIEGRFQGNREGPITPFGKEQTKIFVQALALSKIDTIYHANNKRTEFVAKVLKDRFTNAEIFIDERLNERNCGLYEGKLYHEIYSEDDSITDYAGRYEWKPPRGESHEDVSERANNFIKELIQNPESGEVIMCITSGGVIRTILHQQHNLSLQEMYDLQIPNLYLIRV